MVVCAFSLHAVLKPEASFSFLSWQAPERERERRRRESYLGIAAGRDQDKLERRSLIRENACCH
jgi:hypothetical protein